LQTGRRNSDIRHKANACFRFEVFIGGTASIEGDYEQPVNIS
jgi:hypothetical protein